MYNVEFVKSSFEMSRRQKLIYEDLSNFTQINGVLKENDVLDIQGITGYYTMHVTNDSSVNPEYDVFVILDKEGKGYYTSSPYIMESFQHISDNLQEELFAQDIVIEIIKQKSKNGNPFYKAVLLQ